MNGSRRLIEIGHFTPFAALPLSAISYRKCGQYPIARTTRAPKDRDRTGNRLAPLSDLEAKLNAWIKRQADEPSRPEAIRASSSWHSRRRNDAAGSRARCPVRFQRTEDGSLSVCSASSGSLLQLLLHRSSGNSGDDQGKKDRNRTRCTAYGTGGGIGQNANMYKSPR